MNFVQSNIVIVSQLRYHFASLLFMMFSPSYRLPQIAISQLLLSKLYINICDKKLLVEDVPVCVTTGGLHVLDSSSNILVSAGLIGNSYCFTILSVNQSVRYT